MTEAPVTEEPQTEEVREVVVAEPQTEEVREVVVAGPQTEEVREVVVAAPVHSSPIRRATHATRRTVTAAVPNANRPGATAPRISDPVAPSKSGKPFNSRPYVVGISVSVLIALLIILVRTYGPSANRYLRGV